MDANNVPRGLTLEHLKILQSEIIRSGTMAYETKWSIRSQIEAAQTKEALDAIKIEFTPANFQTV